MSDSSPILIQSDSLLLLHRRHPTHASGNVDQSNNIVQWITIEHALIEDMTKESSFVIRALPNEMKKTLNEHLFHSNKGKKKRNRTKVKTSSASRHFHYPDENKPHRILFIQSNGWIIGFSSLVYSYLVNLSINDQKA